MNPSPYLLVYVKQAFNLRKTRSDGRPEINLNTTTALSTLG